MFAILVLEQDKTSVLTIKLALLRDDRHLQE